MICMEFDNNKMNNVNTTQNKLTEKVDKPKNPFEKKLYRQQIFSGEYKAESWGNKSKNVLLRDLCIDLVLKKRGIFIKSSNPEDYARKCNTEVPKEEVNSVLAARLKHKRRRKELQRQREGKQEGKVGKLEKLKKYQKRRRETLPKLSRNTKNSQPVIKDRLDILLAKIKLNT